MEPTEDELMETLRAALEGPPEDLISAARDLHSFAHVDDALAELVEDSATGAPLGARSGALAIRVLRLEAGGGLIELQFAEATAELHGQVEGPGVETVTLDRPNGASLPVQVRGEGFAVLTPVGPVRLRLILSLGGGSAVAVSTPWLTFR